MWSESEIHNFKKIFLDELGCYFQNNEAEKVFDETFEKARNLDFSEVHDEKLETRPELAAYLKDIFVDDPALTNEENFRNLVRLFMGQFDKELELTLKIFADQEYVEIVENTDLHDKIKKIILKHGPFTVSEIVDFVRENLNLPVLEEIFNDFKGNEDIRNAMKEYGVTAIHPIMPHLIYMEFFSVTENLIEQKER